MAIKNRNLKFIYVGIFSVLIAVGAFIRVPIDPISFSLQTLFVSLAGLLLGAKLGALSAFIYMGLGLLGLPIFTKGGGISYVLQPSFGYILGFIVDAYITGYIASKLAPRPRNYFIAAMAGLLVLHLIGIPYFYIIMHNVVGSNITLAKSIFVCCLQFILQDIIITIPISLIVPRIKEILYR